ncbi:hypothetical protein ABTC85_15705 [Acinetobacter baumannii]|uniref:Uncharacterized protein n=2 Tax=Acinetobacter baumannii TaxID=470 RepID=A0A0C4XXM1_ACIBA|nr:MULTISPECIES: hypothetical protein [Acinetobacter calcoaceticus/baumannii complex]AFI97438.1 hypothetical protein ABTJ_p0060 [Acinetobacter baumannii MDR-TJ]AGQ12331.1 hypothetical protein BJAB0868_p0074 [Acinetobacter baumannii BJAB0868]AGQ16192.1 hypothetical protein BJAB07104_p0064 [Acinetobacter baumannii BJAB07104]AJF79908.1 hypothetical protein NG19_0072 [Acinetobacter baumannii]APF45767.1 hypothetical protein BKJ37_19740 [Acinetobacter baumannii]
MTNEIYDATKLLTAFKFPNKASGEHTFIMGCTNKNKGKSLFQEELKDHPNIIFIEATEDDIAKQKESQRLKNLKDEQRLLSIKECYWSHSKDESFFLDTLKYSLINHFEFFENVDPTIDQLKTLFMYFDDYLIGQIISWGYSDTEVSTYIDEYIDENRDELETMLFK